MFEKELSIIRADFIKKHNLKCETCKHWEEKRKCKCSSKVYCIVRDAVFNCNYKEKDDV